MGGSFDAERQLFGYSVHHGVQLLLLTTGERWQFYLPGEEGTYSDRLVSSLNLQTHSVEIIIQQLTRYLRFDSVVTREAIKDAKTDLGKLVNQRVAHENLPLAWQQLVDESDELLVELITEKVEALSGFRPDPEDVVNFLAQLQVRHKSEEKRKLLPSTTRLSAGRLDHPRVIRHTHPNFEGLGFTLHGQRFVARSARDVVIQTFQHLYTSDPTFPSRFAARQGGGLRRPYLARSKEELYPRSPELAADLSQSRELVAGSGWWIGLNASRPTFDRLLRVACEVANVGYGTEYIPVLQPTSSQWSRRPSRFSKDDKNLPRS